ncbi:MAG: hypothetical protein ACLRZH_16845 [Ruthenibacterium lactatiformans]
MGRRIGSAALEATAMDSRNDGSHGSDAGSERGPGLTGLELDGWMAWRGAVYFVERRAS